MKKLKELPQSILGDGKTPRREVNLADKRVPYIFCTAIGIALGIVAGIILGVATLPATRLVASDNFAPAPATTAVLPASLPSTQETQKPAVQTAAAAPAMPAAVAVVNPDKTLAAPGGSAQNPSLPARVLLTSAPHQMAQGVLQVAVRRVSHRSSHHTRQKIKVNLDLAAIAPVDPSPAIQPPQDEQVTAAEKPQATSTFYVEGDLMVVDFDSSAGKLQTSDGRSFLLNSSSFDNAMNWSDDRLDVHYRCAQGGVCVLQGPGAAPMTARQI